LTFISSIIQHVHIITCYYLSESAQTVGCRKWSEITNVWSWQWTTNIH